jgi:hypothetical protein
LITKPEIKGFQVYLSKIAGCQYDHTHKKISDSRNNVVATYGLPKHEQYCGGYVGVPCDSL